MQRGLCYSHICDMILEHRFCSRTVISNLRVDHPPSLLPVKDLGYAPVYGYLFLKHSQKMKVDSRLKSVSVLNTTYIYVPVLIFNKFTYSLQLAFINILCCGSYFASTIEFFQHCEWCMLKNTD